MLDSSKTVKSSWKLLLNACAVPKGVVILGAGASSPHVPTTKSLPAALRRFAPFVGSFPAYSLPDVPIRRLLGSASEQLLGPEAAFAESKVQHWTGDTIAVALQQLIAAAHQRELPQYRVFGLFPRAACIVSFNWDGLARAYCPQRSVIHPHGTVMPVSLSDSEVVELIDSTQFGDDSDGKLLLGRTLVMIGEEDSRATKSARDQVAAEWLACEAVIIVGYSFGIGSTLDYDRVWRELFVDAMRRNPVPIHVLTPDASALCGALSEEIERSLNIFAWPLSWHAFAQALVSVASECRVRSIAELVRHERELQKRYRKLVNG